MHKGKLILMFVLFINMAFGQLDLVSSFNKTGSGQNLTITISKHYPNKFEFGGGLRININSYNLTSEKNSESYYNRLYTQNFGNYFGFVGNVHRYIFTNVKPVDFFLFYSLNLTYAPIRRINDAHFINPDGTITIIKDYEFIKGPYLWIENLIGLGININLFSRFFIQVKSGASITLMKMNSYDSFKYGGNSSNVIMHIYLGLGIGYRFNKELI